MSINRSNGDHVTSRASAKKVGERSVLLVLIEREQDDVEYGFRASILSARFSFGDRVIVFLSKSH